MEYLLVIPLGMVVLFFPFLTGAIAVSLGRKFWGWFLLGLVLPFIGVVVLLCLPLKEMEFDILNNKN